MQRKLKSKSTQDRMTLKSKIIALIILSGIGLFGNIALVGLFYGNNDLIAMRVPIIGVIISLLSLSYGYFLLIKYNNQKFIKTYLWRLKILLPVVAIFAGLTVIYIIILSKQSRDTTSDSPSRSPSPILSHNQGQFQSHSLAQFQSDRKSDDETNTDDVVGFLRSFTFKGVDFYDLCEQYIKTNLITWDKFDTFERDVNFADEHVVIKKIVDGIKLDKNKLEVLEGFITDQDQNKSMIDGIIAVVAMNQIVDNSRNLKLVQVQFTKKWDPRLENLKLTTPYFKHFIMYNILDDLTRQQYHLEAQRFNSPSIPFIKALLWSKNWRDNDINTHTLNESNFDRFVQDMSEVKEYIGRLNKVVRSGQYKLDV